MTHPFVKRYTTMLPATANQVIRTTPRRCVGIPHTQRHAVDFGSPVSCRDRDARAPTQGPGTNFCQLGALMVGTARQLKPA
jgi:hypothetical protein